MSDNFRRVAMYCRRGRVKGRCQHRTILVRLLSTAVQGRLQTFSFAYYQPYLSFHLRTTSHSLSRTVKSYP